MKKLIAGAIAGAALLAMAAPLMAAKMEKVEICHVTDSNTLGPNNPWTEVVGHRINVSGNALSSHQAHGDFVYSEAFDIDADSGLWGLSWREMAENNGLNLAGVNCSGFVADF